MSGTFLDKVDGSALADMLVYKAAHPLLFNTGMFLLLFAGFLLLYQVCRRRRTLRMLLTIAFSLYFYYKNSGWCCLILVGVCVSDFGLGILLDRTGSEWRRKAIVFLNVVVNVGMLAYFKYFNLILQTFAGIASVHFDALDIVLPAGISFFTFRSISYIVDIYRCKITACRSFVDYMFFLTFFPPLLAGPVVRAADMLPQIRMSRGATRQMTAEGMFLIMSGLIKKMVIADYISGNFVDRIFENPALYSGFENLMGSIGFTLQIYCDFSGYSDMAIGIALLLGFRFFDNFDSPFKSQNPTEFWRRWHISLSTWLRDYVYIPLGGNRCGKVRRHANLITTFVLGGLWHGASWMYVLWGGYQGLLLSGHKIIGKAFPKHRLQRYRALTVGTNVFITFVLTVIGFTIFKCADLEHLRQMGVQVFTAFNPGIALQFARAYGLILTAMGIGFALHFSPGAWRTHLLGRYVAMPLVWQALILAVVIFVVIQTRSSDLVPFVYLQY